MSITARTIGFLAVASSCNAIKVSKKALDGEMAGLALVPEDLQMPASGKGALSQPLVTFHGTSLPQSDRVFSPATFEPAAEPTKSEPSKKKKKNAQLKLKPKRGKKLKKKKSKDAKIQTEADKKKKAEKKAIRKALKKAKQQRLQKIKDTTSTLDDVEIPHVPQQPEDEPTSKSEAEQPAWFAPKSLVDTKPTVAVPETGSESLETDDKMDAVNNRPSSPSAGSFLKGTAEHGSEDPNWKTASADNEFGVPASSNKLSTSKRNFWNPFASKTKIESDAKNQWREFLTKELQFTEEEAKKYTKQIYVGEPKAFAKFGPVHRALKEDHANFNKFATADNALQAVSMTDLELQMKMEKNEESVKIAARVYSRLAVEFGLDWTAVREKMNIFYRSFSYQKEELLKIAQDGMKVFFEEHFKEQSVSLDEDVTINKSCVLNHLEDLLSSSSAVAQNETVFKQFLRTTAWNQPTTGGFFKDLQSQASHYGPKALRFADKAVQMIEKASDKYDEYTEKLQKALNTSKKVAKVIMFILAFIGAVGVAL